MILTFLPFPRCAIFDREKGYQNAAAGYSRAYPQGCQRKGGGITVTHECSHRSPARTLADERDEVEGPRRRRRHREEVTVDEEVDAAQGEVDQHTDGAGHARMAEEGRDYLREADQGRLW